MFNNASEAIFHIGVTQIVDDIGDKVTDDLESLARAAYAATVEANEKRRWAVSMPGDDDTLFRIGTGTVLVILARCKNHGDTARVKQTVDIMKALGAAVDGVPVDWSALVEDNELEPVPLQRWFEEAKSGTR